MLPIALCNAVDARHAVDLWLDRGESGTDKEQLLVFPDLHLVTDEDAATLQRHNVEWTNSKRPGDVGVPSFPRLHRHPEPRRPHS